MRLPEIGIRFRERDSCFYCSAVLRPKENDAAVLLSLCQLIGKQYCLSLVYRDAQQQKCAICIHVQGVRFFMERSCAGSVAIHVHGDVERPAAASPPVRTLNRVRLGRFRLRFAGPNRLRVLQCFKNSAHFHPTAQL